MITILFYQVHPREQNDLMVEWAYQDVLETRDCPIKCKIVVGRVLCRISVTCSHCIQSVKSVR